jgi:hypothetical protein
VVIAKSVFTLYGETETLGRMDLKPGGTVNENSVGTLFMI